MRSAKDTGIRSQNGARAVCFCLSPVPYISTLEEAEGCIAEREGRLAAEARIRKLEAEPRRLQQP